MASVLIFNIVRSCCHIKNPSIEDKATVLPMLIEQIHCKNLSKDVAITEIQYVLFTVISIGGYPELVGSRDGSV